MPAASGGPDADIVGVNEASGPGIPTQTITALDLGALRADPRILVTDLAGPTADLTAHKAAVEAARNGWTATARLATAPLDQFGNPIRTAAPLVSPGPLDPPALKSAGNERC